MIERTGRGRLERILSGSTANGSAVLCTAPLLSVPHDWSPEAAARRPAVVTVAVQDVAEARDLVPVAATEAGAHGCELVVLHAIDHWDGADVADLLELADLPTSAGVRDADLRDRWVERTRTALAGVTRGEGGAGTPGPPGRPGRDLPRDAQRRPRHRLRGLPPARARTPAARPPVGHPRGPGRPPHPARRDLPRAAGRRERRPARVHPGPPQPRQLPSRPSPGRPPSPSRSCRAT